MFTVGMRFRNMAHNGFGLGEGGDFEALNFLPPQNLIRIGPPISCRRCYRFGVLFRAWLSVGCALAFAQAL